MKSPRMRREHETGGFVKKVGRIIWPPLLLILALLILLFAAAGGMPDFDFHMNPKD